MEKFNEKIYKKKFIFMNFKVYFQNTYKIVQKAPLQKFTKKIPKNSNMEKQKLKNSSQGKVPKRPRKIPQEGPKMLKEKRSKSL